MTARTDNAALALLNQDAGIAVELRTALQGFGANVVYETSIEALDRAQLKSSGARIVVINLGDNEDALDDIQDLLESSEYEIVVNDSAVSAQLKGPDQARWVRHLAAKILHRPEIVLPPRPAGAEAPPTFEQHWAAQVPVAEVIGEAPAVPYKPAQVAPVAAAGSASVATETLQAPAQTAAENFAHASEAANTEDADLEHALERFDTFAAASVTASNADAVSEANLDDADFARALENFDAAESAAPAQPNEDVADLEALLLAAHGQDALAARESEQTEEMRDMNFGTLDIDSIDAALTSVEVTQSPTPTPAPKAAPPAPAKPAVAAPDWSLAPTDEGERSSVAEIAREFGIEKVPAEVYLTPQVDEPQNAPIDPKEIGAAIPRGFASLELEPIETETDSKPKNEVAYDTGRDLELPTQATKPPKRDEDKPKES